MAMMIITEMFKGDMFKLPTEKFVFCFETNLSNLMLVKIELTSSPPPPLIDQVKILHPSA